MRDLTTGPVPKHLIGLAAPIAAGMIFQTLYNLVDIYFVGKLGEVAIAGVSAGGNVQFIVMALTQILAVGTMSLVAQAAGRKDHQEVDLLFNQSLVLGLLCCGAFWLGGYGLGLVEWYMGTLGADAGTIAAGNEYLRWFLPGLGLQFVMTAMGATLRGVGIAMPTMVIQIISVTLNAILSPILIIGWGTGHPMGVAGAGLASSISLAVGLVLLTIYFVRSVTYARVERSLARPRLGVWKRMLQVGLPPGGEFALLFVYMGVIYWVIRDFGAAAQAGFGVGSRVMQAVFLPAMAVAFATAPVAGQNFGAGMADRVRETFRTAAWLGSAIMLTLTLLCQIRPDWFIRGFTADADVIAVGGEFLRIISWNFVASGLIFTCSGMFQALGNTLPALQSSASRLLTFVVPAVWLSTVPAFELHHLWYLSVASVGSQALLSLWFLRGTMVRKLQPFDETKLPSGDRSNQPLE